MLQSKTVFLSLILTIPFFAQAQLSPAVTSWVINSDNSTGYGNQLTNVLSVDYTNNYSFVSCTCIPGYDIGPWVGNPNDAANQDFCFRISLNPVENTGTEIESPLGHIGVWVNGVSIFSAKDASSYNNQGVWFQDALVFEGSSFDACLGHPAGNGEYHHHVNPTCLYNDSDEDNHSPIIGYAFDGFPIYGAYGYAEALSIGETIVMTSGYQLRNISSRQTLADGTNLPAYQYGPTIGGQYPLGSFIQDYEYVAGSGSLDEHNGRFCVTPEYPEGTFAYFVTIDEYLDPVYPYVIGPTYFGNVATGNTGPQSGHNNIPSFAENYSPDSDECLGDINGDGARTIIDLLLILGEFGCMSSCSADIDGDGTVTVGDALNFLSMFGQDC
jgi:hypothetical protein|tara:strand:- start:1064 stop:2215 length:1152 start_codon:yes stop_codon:yes gene_type:complete